MRREFGIEFVGIFWLSGLSGSVNEVLLLPTFGYRLERRWMDVYHEAALIRMLFPFVSSVFTHLYSLTIRESPDELGDLLGQSRAMHLFALPDLSGTLMMQSMVSRKYFMLAL